ncbi:dUTP pyrophosphatase [Nematocida sp. AWRm77]|nr:dUTP pyrophosphatase [Nematocida sp. AWRm77]
MTEEETTKAFKVQLLREDAMCPQIATKGSAGYDLYTPVSGSIKEGERQKINLGIKIELPENHFGQICGRSGLAAKHGIVTLGGVIDQDYRGELCVLLLNTGKEVFHYQAGDRIAQLVIPRIFTERPAIVETLQDTVRSVGGFGSTGR